MTNELAIVIGSIIIILFFIFQCLLDKWLNGDFNNDTKLYKEINVLKYLNSDIKEIDDILIRLQEEISLNLIKRKWQLRQRFSDLVVSYGYVPKLELKITKQIKRRIS